MVYVLDTNSFKICENYYPSVFPAFWENLNRLVDHERLASVSEVKKELENLAQQDHLFDWIDDNDGIFSTPTTSEMMQVTQILGVPHFQQLIGRKQLLRGSPVADPFVIARAMEHDGCVVTEETHRQNSGKIPNVCEHFGIECMKMQKVLQKEGWSY